jgi:ribosomal protein S27AE
MLINRIASRRMPIRCRLEEAPVESTFHIFKVTPDGPLTQMCTMKCPRCGSTACKEKPEERFRCERCGWKL